MTLRIPLEVDASGNQKTVAQLLAIQQQIERLGKSADGLTAVAQALGTSYKAAKTLAESIGLTGAQTAKAVASIRVLVAAGADTESRFSALSEKLGITRNQFDALEKSVAAYNTRQNQIAQGSKAIEATLARQQQLLKQPAQTPASTPTAAPTKSGGEGFDPKASQAAKQAAKEVGDAAGEAKSRIDSVFQGLGKGVGGTALAFNSIVQSLGLITGAAQKAYSLLIGQNTELQQQLLGTQSTLAATNKVFENGVEIKDPTKAIQALEGPVNDAVDKIRQGSFELVGVTSSSLVPLFQVIAGQSANIGANLNQSADLALDFGAALGTLGIPLDQARQEILSILQGQINSDSQLAKSIGLNNEQVNQYKEQGVLVDKLREKLSAFRAGNALAAKTVGGVSSNITELVQEFTRLAGEPLLEPLVAQLSKLEGFLKANKDQIQAFANGATEGFLAFATSVGESVSAIGTALLPIVQKLGPVASDVITLVLQGFQSLTATTVVLTEKFGPAIEGATELAAKAAEGFQNAQQAIGLLTGATNDSTEAIATLVDTTGRLGAEGVKVQGDLKAAIEARANAQKNGKKLTDDEAKAEKAALQQKGSLTKALKDQLQALNQTVAIGPDNVATLEAQKQEVKARIAALEKDSAALEKNAGSIKLVANTNKEAGDGISSVADKIGTVNDAIDKQLSQATIAENNALTAITELEAKGATSKEEIEQKKLAATKNRINAELEAEQSRLASLKAITPSKDDKENKAREAAIQKSEEKISQLRLAGAQSQIKNAKIIDTSDKLSSDKIIQNAKDRVAKVTAAEAQAVLAIVNLQADGSISKEEAEKRKLAATETRIKAELAAERQALAELQEMPKDSDPKKEKERQDAIKSSTDKITQLELTAAQARLDKREAAEKAALERITKANENAETKIQASQQARITAVKEAQIQALKEPGADREAIERDSAAKIEAIQQSTIAKEVESKKKALADIQTARASGEISVKVAGESEKKLTQEIGQLNQQRLDAELQAIQRNRDERVKALQAETQQKIQPLENDSTFLGSVRNPFLQNTNELLGAQLELSNSLAALDQQRLTYAIEDAQTVGNTVQAQQLQEQLFASQNVQLEEQNRIKLEQNAIDNEQKINQAEIALNQAQINLLTAEEALLRAQIEGRSLERLHCFSAK